MHLKYADFTELVFAKGLEIGVLVIVIEDSILYMCHYSQIY